MSIAEHNDLTALIEALTLFRKYGNPAYPTHCEHDELLVFIDPSLVSGEDKRRLLLLGFSEDEDDRCFRSYRFGSR